MAHSINERIALATMRFEQRVALRYDGTLPAMHKEFIPAIAAPAKTPLAYKALVIGLIGMAFTIGAAYESKAAQPEPLEYIRVNAPSNPWELRETVGGDVYIRDHALTLADCTNAMLANLDKAYVCADPSKGQ